MTGSAKMENENLIIQKLNEILSLLKTQTPAHVAEVDGPVISMAAMKAITGPFVAAKCTSGLKKALQDLGVTSVVELTTRIGQNKFLVRVRELTQELPDECSKQVFTALEDIDKTPNSKEV
jgi:hypothetical protein